MTSDQARHVRQAGHNDELRFAHLIGLSGVYTGDTKGKTDVIDRNGDAHSVKSGNLKWQIFLYRRSRIEADPDFGYMDGIGEILINCIDAFPEIRDDYVENKPFYKSRLQPHMRALRNKLADRGILSEFFDKAMFNAGEVEYLTVLQNDQFHVFYRQDVLRVLSAQISVENSKARNPNLSRPLT
ncbi:MAG: hypothetical protein OXG92_09815 [Chloroflexi bacterium]|nr:hypothetical protein [Chloroflexota bacterium]MCY3581539.1 hypothetical protein [Chloroflexota bacterium]MCY3716746.1 hypothetical protein [Chloroflexota bacterium]MDE2651090.1 hypothetical protein [Chloroflexota bacterium]MXX49811.1 hypothetical protein [Chloroflexota bacterium]